MYLHIWFSTLLNLLIPNLIFLSLDVIVIPPCGAVCPATVKSSPWTIKLLVSCIVPLTSNIIVAGLAWVTAHLKEPTLPSSNKLVTL